jgi:aspartate aminotransferase
MIINSQVASLNKSATLKITALTKKLIAEGKDVVNFAAGEPDFDTPESIKSAACTAVAEGFTKYTPSAGMLPLREAIAADFQSIDNITYQSKNIIVTSGAKYALYVAFLTLLSPGDEIIIPSPFWVSYPEMATLCKARVKLLRTTPQNDFKIVPGKLEAAITKTTKVLILNYPSNPTGMTYTRQELEDLSRVVKSKDLFVVSDEIYRALVYDGLKHTGFASLEGMFEKTITVNGFSKTYSMTGWRLGYLAAPDDIAAQASKIIDHTTSCASSISQRAGIAALADKNIPLEVNKLFQARRDMLWNGLSEVEGLTVYRPKGTFYMFCDISKTGLSSFEFASQLLERKMVSCIPAESFGWEGFVRLSFATSDAQIIKGIERIREFLSEIKA